MTVLIDQVKQSPVQGHASVVLTLYSSSLSGVWLSNELSARVLAYKTQDLLYIYTTALVEQIIKTCQ